jgi:2-oxoglutarate dehydrogenase E2 component (dihydrolipoamide succinyltransferase)
MMATDILVPTLGESVTTATVARWIKQAGEKVAADEPLVELETDKVTVEVNAPSGGVLASISVPEGSEVDVGAVLGTIDAAGAGAEAAPTPKPAASPQSGVNAPPRPLGPVARPATPPSDVLAAKAAPAPLPAAAKMMAEKSVTAEAVGTGAGKDGRITKGDG